MEAYRDEYEADEHEEEEEEEEFDPESFEWPSGAHPEGVVEDVEDGECVSSVTFSEAAKIGFARQHHCAIWLALQHSMPGHQLEVIAPIHHA